MNYTFSYPIYTIGAFLIQLGLRRYMFEILLVTSCLLLPLIKQYPAEIMLKVPLETIISTIPTWDTDQPPNFFSIIFSKISGNQFFQLNIKIGLHLRYKNICKKHKRPQGNQLGSGGHEGFCICIVFLQNALLESYCPMYQVCKITHSKEEFISRK